MASITDEAMERLVKRELKKLHEDVQEYLFIELSPWVPMPRPKMFKFTKGVTWPAIGPGGALWNRVDNLTALTELTYAALPRLIASACEYQPRKLMRAIKQIRTAAQWCQDRADGRIRSSQEVLKQQKKWSSLLHMEVALSEASLIVGDEE